MMKTACPICGNSHLDSLITLDHIPYFENWLCDSEILAKQMRHTKYDTVPALWICVQQRV